ncbi:MAG: phospholipase D-like domain-containing protein [Chloroflexi bacterium]|nr:phospholipase D-like domain-containing protein [Chloroflexota bacterium]
MPDHRHRRPYDRPPGNRAPKPAAFWLALLSAVLIACRPATALPQAPAAAQPPAAQGEVNLVVLPDAGLSPTLEALRSAKTSVRLMMYLAGERDTQIELIAAKRRGVDVRVLLENDPVGEGDGNAREADQLRSAGVQVQWGAPAFQLTHAKVLLVDGKQAHVMSYNWVISAFRYNREFGLIMTDPSVVQALTDLFDADWKRMPSMVTHPSLIVTPDNARARFAALLAEATQSIEVEHQDLQDRAFENELIKASKRGVSESDRDATGRGRVREAGADVRLLSPPQPFIHAKMLLIDGKKLFVGSQNLTTQAMERNREVGAVTTAPEAVAEARSVFEGDWKNAK